MAMMDKLEFLDLCGPYALGALDEIDAIRFRAAIAGADAEMRAALTEALRLAEDLSLAAPVAVPSPAVRTRLMARIRTTTAPATKPEAPRRKVREVRESAFRQFFGNLFSPSPGFAFALSMLAVSAGLVAYAVSLRETVEDQRAGIGARDGLIAQLADSLVDADSVRADLVALRDTLTRRQALLAMLRCPATREIALATPNLGADSARAVHGKLMWDPDHGFAVLQVALPGVPDTNDYQLWMIRGGKPVSAGVFHVASKPDSLGALYRLDALNPTEPQGKDIFAVTLEPKGGVPKPTGSMVLSGNLEI